VTEPVEYWTFPRRAALRYFAWFWFLGMVFGLATGYLMWK
jgi:hypothetical protein